MNSWASDPYITKFLSSYEAKEWGTVVKDLIHMGIRGLVTNYKNKSFFTVAELEAIARTAGCSSKSETQEQLQLIQEKLGKMDKHLRKVLKHDRKSHKKQSENHFGENTCENKYNLNTKECPRATSISYTRSPNKGIYSESTVNESANNAPCGHLKLNESKPLSEQPSFHYVYR